MFYLLITNVDDHLQNLGFLHVSNAQSRLAPAFDLNPFPDKDRESKTWLSADVGKSVSDWRTAARHAPVGRPSHALDDFAPAFEHEQMDATRKLLG